MGSKSGSKSDAKKHAKRCYIKLMKDRKLICRTQCINPPLLLPPCWAIDIVKRKSVKGLNDLPQFNLYPAPEDTPQKSEWNKFLPFLHKHDKIAVVEFHRLKMYISPSEPADSTKTTEDLCFTHVVVAYDRKKFVLQEGCDTTVDQKHGLAVELDVNVKGSISDEKGTCSSISKCYGAVNSDIPISGKDSATEKNFVRADPSYLKTLSQAHSGWIFGAIAELVDNSRDAKASRMGISVETIYDKTSGCEIPMLSVVDDGVGMDHKEILRMVSFGHKQPDEDDINHIGRFGVGFKTGSMRLGKRCFSADTNYPIPFYCFSFTIVE